MSSLVDIVRQRGAEQPDRTAYVYLNDGEAEAGRFTFAQLDAHARAIAGLLRERGVKPGDRVLLLYPPSLDYVGAFFGCLFAGAVAVPAYPPRPRGPIDRLVAIAKDARAGVALTTSQIVAAVEEQQLGGVARALKWIATDGLDTTLGASWSPLEIKPDTLAFLQYTSGSTSTPKGVMVTHGNLMCNERMIQAAFEHDQDSTVVGWLPMFHDMGLIGNVIQPLYMGASAILMAPTAFIQEPIRWLKAITKYRARTSGGPNFAYDLCVAKTTPETRAGLDLSSWTLAFNGSEPVRADTMERFAKTFAPYGFQREALYPCYGLAEATLFVTGPRKGGGPLVRSFDTAGLEQRSARPSSEASARPLVGCGQSWLEQTIVIADMDTGKRCRDGDIGEIWIWGANVADGYWNRPEATEEVFQARLTDSGDGPFLRTGDLGFLHDGQLFISGRIKDLIIIRGRNHFPQDIERTVETSHAALRAGSGAAFSVDVDGEERLVVVQEVGRQFKASDVEDVINGIRQRVMAEHELATHAVALIKPGQIAKTSSGKIQRGACRKTYLDGSLDALVVSVLDGAPQEGAAAAGAGASLLRRTLEALGPVGGHALLESHLRELAGKLNEAPSTPTRIESIDRARLHRAVEAELGVSVGNDVVSGASSFGDLASRLIALVTESPPTSQTSL